MGDLIFAERVALSLFTAREEVARLKAENAELRTENERLKALNVLLLERLERVRDYCAWEGE